MAASASKVTHHARSVSGISDISLGPEAQAGTSDPDRRVRYAVQALHISQTPTAAELAPRVSPRHIAQMNTAAITMNLSLRRWDKTCKDYFREHGWDPDEILAITKELSLIEAGLVQDHKNEYLCKTLIQGAIDRLDIEAFQVIPMVDLSDVLAILDEKISNEDEDGAVYCQMKEMALNHSSKNKAVRVLGATAAL